MSKLYPIGIQDFEDLRKKDYIYVDKTVLIYQLVSSGKYYLLSHFLLQNYASFSVTKSPYEIQRFVEEVCKGDVDSFLSRLQTFFDDIPYELAPRDREVHYQNILYIVFKLMGFHSEVEYHTSRGRVDLVLKTSDYIYVMEFKLDGTAEEAMAQINAKWYASAFAADGRKVVKVWVNFSSQTRAIERWIIA